MRRRWQLLFACSLVTLAGVAWLAEGFKTGPSVWLEPELLGMLAACGVAFAALAVGTRRRWPAAVVVLCVVPLARSVLQVLAQLAEFAVALGVPGLLLVFGTLATVSIALFTLLVPPPPPPIDDPVPRARLNA